MNGVGQCLGACGVFRSNDVVTRCHAVQEVLQHHVLCIQIYMNICNMYMNTTKAGANNAG
jgi:hypothetical protein